LVTKIEARFQPLGELAKASLGFADARVEPDREARAGDAVCDGAVRSRIVKIARPARAIRRPTPA
jgi:hypothetical protein